MFFNVQHLTWVHIFHTRCLNELLSASQIYHVRKQYVPISRNGYAFLLRKKEVTSISSNYLNVWDFFQRPISKISIQSPQYCLQEKSERKYSKSSTFLLAWQQVNLHVSQYQHIYQPGEIPPPLVLSVFQAQ